MVRFIKGGLKQRYLVSFIFVSIVPILIIVTLFYFPVERIFREEAIKSDAVKSRQIRDITDTRIREILNMSIQMSIDKTIGEFFYRKAPLDESGYFYIKSVCDVLNGYKSINSFISFLGVYFVQSESVVTPDGSYNSDYFFENILKYDGLSSSEVKNLMRGAHYYEFLPLKPIKGNYILDGKYVTYIQSLPMTEKNALANIIMVIDEKSMLSNIGETIDSRNGQVMILSGDGDLIADRDSYSGMRETVLKEIKEENGMNKQKDTFVVYSPMGTKMVASVSLSEITGWNYIVLSDMDSVIARIARIRNLAVFIAFLSLISCIILSFLMARYSYNPWVQLVMLLKSSRNKLLTDKSSDNEFQYTRDAITNMLEESEQLKCDVKKSKEYETSYILQNLCAGKNIHDEALSSIKSIFPYDSFYVILTDIDSNAYFHVPMSAFITKYAGIYFKNGTAYTYEDDKERICTIINAKSHECIMMVKLIGHIKEALSRHFSIQLFTGIGGIYTNINNIHISLNEARKALEYSYLRGRESTIFYPEIQNDILSAINLPVYSDNPLLNIVKTGDYNSCSKLLDQYFSSIINTGEASIQYIHCLYYNFISVILKACDEVNASIEEVFNESPEQLMDINRFRNIKQVIESVYKIYMLMCEYIQKNKTPQNTGLINDIEKYIKERYSDKNLSLIDLADEFGYAPTYLSRYIKQNLGVGFGELLPRIRLENAKRLLLSSKLQISEISNMTGHASLNSFIRTFKRIEGLTPGQYRETKGIL